MDTDLEIRPWRTRLPCTGRLGPSSTGPCSSSATTPPCSSSSSATVHSVLPIIKLVQVRLLARLCRAVRRLLECTYPFPEVGVGLLEHDDAVKQGGGVGDAAPARGVRHAVPLVHRDRRVPPPVHPRGPHVVDVRLLARLAHSGARVERVRRVVGAPVPVEEGAHGRLHLPRRHHPAHHHHREPPQHGHRPLVHAVVAHGLLRHCGGVEPHGALEQPAQRTGPGRRGREHGLQEQEVQVVLAVLI
jgi:hypothetical protein